MRMSRIAASSGSSPVFQKVLDEERVERVPVLEVLKRQPKQVALTALLRMPEQAPGYISSAPSSSPTLRRCSALRAILC